MQNNVFLNVTSDISKARRPGAGGWSSCLLYSRNWINHITVLVSEQKCPVFPVAYYFSSFAKDWYGPKIITGLGRPTGLVV